MKTQQKNVAAGIIGNVLEWYDFAIYGYMVPVLSALFFPSDNPTVSIIAAFSAFAAGYFARPLGGVIFGWVGDKLGRKAVLTISVTMMGLAHSNRWDCSLLIAKLAWQRLSCWYYSEFSKVSR